MAHDLATQSIAEVMELTSYSQTRVRELSRMPHHSNHHFLLTFLYPSLRSNNSTACSVISLLTSEITYVNVKLISINFDIPETKGDRYDRCPIGTIPLYSWRFT